MRTLIYDGMRVVQERDGDNAPLVSYTRGTDLSGSLEGAGGIGGLLGRSHGYSSGNWITNNFYFADGNGNITYMLDGSQSTVASYRYDPFGNTISQSGTLADANVYRFSSKEIHVTTGMYYYGYRWYSPDLQRWLNRDPIGERAWINLFHFVNNAPTHWLDPFGTYVRAAPGQRGYITPLPPAPTPFENCDPRQKESIQKARDSACDRINKCANPDCDQSQLQALKELCKSKDKPRFKCASSDDERCKKKIWNGCAREDCQPSGLWQCANSRSE